MRKIFLGVLALGLSTTAFAQQSANISDRSTRESRSQLEQGINEESSREIQRQRGHEGRSGEETRSTETSSQRQATEWSDRLQDQSTDRISIKTAPLALLNEVFSYVERGQSAQGATAQQIRRCALVTRPQAPQLLQYEPKAPVLSVQACMSSNTEKSLAECKFENKQALFNWVTTGMPLTTRVPAQELHETGACWALYGLVAEATMGELASGTSIPQGSGITLGLAQAMAKQLARSDLPGKAKRIAELQMGGNCVIPTQRGYRYEGRYDWSCGSFVVDPRALTATIGELTIYGRGNSIFGQTWDLETSRSQDTLFSSSRSHSNSRESSISDARYASSDQRHSQSQNLSMRMSERLQTERAANVSQAAESGFSVSQPGMGGN